MSASINVFDHAGKKTKSMTLSKEIFEAPASEKLLDMAVRVYLSNQRQGTKKTKTRSEVIYSTRKLWRQKGTGRARHGSRRAPIFVGGSKAHGPTGNENYNLKLTKKMRRRAIYGALSQRQADNAIIAIDKIETISEKTKDLINLLNKTVKLSQNKKSTLIILDKPHKNLISAARNIKKVTLTQASRLNAYEVLAHQNIIFSTTSLRMLEEKTTKKSGKIKKEQVSPNNKAAKKS